MAKPRFNDRFVAGTLMGALPLLVWAAHFFIAYLTVKTACALDLQRFTFDGIPLITTPAWLVERRSDRRAAMDDRAPRRRDKTPF